MDVGVQAGVVGTRDGVAGVVEPARHGAETGLVRAEAVHQEDRRCWKRADPQLRRGADDTVVHPASQQPGGRGDATTCLHCEISGRNAKTWLEHGASPRWSERSARRHRGGNTPPRYRRCALQASGRPRAVAIVLWCYDLQDRRRVLPETNRADGYKGVVAGIAVAGGLL